MLYRKASNCSDKRVLKDLKHTEPGFSLLSKICDNLEPAFIVKELEGIKISASLGDMNLVKELRAFTYCELSPVPAG